MVDTDGGQTENPHWELALAEYMQYLVDHGIPEEQVYHMTHTIPAKTVGASKNRGTHHMLSAVLVASIAVAVILGYKTKINTGFFCIAFAYLIGCFGMGLKTKELIGFWPVSTMFVILSVSLFYNFAAVNGTLEKSVGQSSLYVP